MIIIIILTAAVVVVVVIGTLTNQYNTESMNNIGSASGGIGNGGVNGSGLINTNHHSNLSHHQHGSETDLISVAGMGGRAGGGDGGSSGMGVSFNSIQGVPVPGKTGRVQVNQQQLQRAWDVSQRSTSDDWNEWLRRLTVELLRESSSPCLRSCTALAQSYSPLGELCCSVVVVLSLCVSYRDPVVCFL